MERLDPFAVEGDASRAGAGLDRERVETFHHAHHLCRCPLSVPARGRDLPRIEAVCDGP